LLIVIDAAVAGGISTVWKCNWNVKMIQILQQRTSTDIFQLINWNPTRMKEIVADAEGG
jgi:hypothetical protein